MRSGFGKLEIGFALFSSFVFPFSLSCCSIFRIGTFFGGLRKLFLNFLIYFFFLIRFSLYRSAIFFSLYFLLPFSSLSLFLIVSCFLFLLFSFSFSSLSFPFFLSSLFLLFFFRSLLLIFSFYSSPFFFFFLSFLFFFFVFSFSLNFLPCVRTNVRWRCTRRSSLLLFIFFSASVMILWGSILHVLAGFQKFVDPSVSFPFPGGSHNISLSFFFFF